VAGSKPRAVLMAHGLRQIFCGIGANPQGLGRLATGPTRFAVVMDVTNIGGAEIQMLEIFRHFDPAVVVPRLVCLREGGPMADEFRAAGFDVDVLDRSGRYDWRTIPRLVRNLRHHRTEAVLVLHFHRAALVLGLLAASVARVRLRIVAIRNMDLTRVGRRCLPRYVVHTLFLTNVMVLQAPSQGRYLHEEEGVGRYPWSRIKEVVIPNGIPIPELSTVLDRERVRAILGLDVDDVVVGIAARLCEQKAHHVLIESIARLASDHPRLRLVVVGEGPREAELRALVERRNISERVLFTGVRRDVPSLLPGFDISCLSSLHEGTPVFVIESMAAGLPVVVTDCGALRDMITDSREGFLVPVGDVASLADRIGRLASSPELRAQQGTLGRKRAERDYRIELTTKRFEALLNG